MIFRLLGSAAGGGFPQWNCACANCSRLRAGQSAAKPRTQSQLAVSRDGRDWHLVNASPDLLSQIVATAELHARPEHGTRNSPIRSITLTNADLDHVLGLLLLRESQPLVVHSTGAVRRLLLEDNSFFGMLRQTEGQTRWENITPGAAFELEAGLRVQPISLSDRFPRYVSPERARGLTGSEAVLGLVISGSDGRSLGYFPGLGEVTPELERVFASCAVLLIDGTFWDETELRRAHSGPGIKTAREMNHLSLSGPSGTIARLAGLKARKIFTHINNTNPILDERSPEHRAARDAGWEVGFDGMEIRL